MANTVFHKYIMTHATCLDFAVMKY